MYKDLYQDLLTVARGHPAVSHIAELDGSLHGGAPYAIHFKPFLIGKVKMKGMCIIVGYQDDRYEYRDRRDQQHWLILYQQRPFPHVHPHRKSGGDICSAAHSYMIEAFEAKRYDEVITTGLVYAMTVNYYGCIEPTPGAFICKVCNRAIWGDHWVTGDEGLVHLACVRRCYLCGDRYTKIEDFVIDRHAIPHSGLKRNLCQRCLDRTRSRRESYRSWQCVECRQLRTVWFDGGLVWSDQGVKCNSCYSAIRRIEDELDEIATGRRRLRFEREVHV